MKDLIIMLGAIGGCIVLVEETYWLLLRTFKWIKKYHKMKWFFEENYKKDNEKPTMGFKTKSEQAEIEAKLQGRMR